MKYNFTSLVEGYQKTPAAPKTATMTISDSHRREAEVVVEELKEFGIESAWTNDYRKLIVNTRDLNTAFFFFFDHSDSRCSLCFGVAPGVMGSNKQLFRQGKLFKLAKQIVAKHSIWNEQVHGEYDAMNKMQTLNLCEKLEKSHFYLSECIREEAMGNVPSDWCKSSAVKEVKTANSIRARITSSTSLF